MCSAQQKLAGKQENFRTFCRKICKQNIKTVCLMFLRQSSGCIHSVRVTARRTTHRYPNFPMRYLLLGIPISLLYAQLAREETSSNCMGCGQPHTPTGLIRNGQSIFRVFLTCGASLSHNWSEKLLSVVASALMKLS
jgi:hypothetical protein